VVWDFAIRDSGTQGSDLAWTVEGQEMRGDVASAGDAIAIYSEAEGLYREMGARRGLATLSLRRAFLSALAGCFDEALASANEAVRDFEQCGDGLGYWTAQSHRLLAQIGAGLFLEDVETARAIGVWGAGEGSFSYALGLGLFFGRAGRYWLVRKGKYENALACYRLSRAVYDALGCVSNSGQSLTDFAVVHQAIGSTSAAMSWYDEALSEYDRAITRLPRIVSNLRGRQVSIVSDMYFLGLRVMDTAAMESCADRLASLAQLLPVQEGNFAEILETVRRIQAQLQSGKLSDIPTEAVETWVLKRFTEAIRVQAKVYIPLYRATRVRDDGDVAIADMQFATALEAAASAGPEADELRAVILTTQRKYPDAIEAFRRYRASGGLNSGLTGDLLGIISTVGGERWEAEEKKQKERNYDLAFLFFVRAKAYSEAKEELDRLIAIAGNEWWQEQDRPWMSLSACAELYENLDQLDAALQYHDLAIKELETRRQELTRDDFKTALAGESGSKAVKSNQHWSRFLSIQNWSTRWCFQISPA
jgi:tetratricopeptide (TPR) repeat protein